MTAARRWSNGEAVTVDDLLLEQAALDAQGKLMAAEIVESQSKLMTDVESWKRFARSWIETAAQHARNEAYWRERALQAESTWLRRMSRKLFGLAGIR